MMLDLVLSADYFYAKMQNGEEPVSGYFSFVLKRAQPVSRPVHFFVHHPIAAQPRADLEGGGFPARPAGRRRARAGPGPSARAN